MQNVNSIKTLTSIRFFAAFYVLIFHCLMRWDIPVIPPFIKHIVAMGPMSMSLFFILSGFILCYNYYDINIKTDYIDFLIKRFARVYPVYICAAILTIPFITLTINPSYEHLFLNHVELKVLINFLQVMFLAISNILLIQGWFPGLFSYWNDGGSWSLSVEVFCYILLPLFIVLFRRVKSTALTYLMILFYLLTILPGFAYLLFYPQPLFSTIYALPIFRLPEFLIGILLCLFYRKRLYSSVNYHKVLFYILLIWGMYSALIGYKIPGYVTSNIIIIPVCSILIYAVANLKSGALFNLLTSKTAIILGESSYCLYLLQALPIQFFEKYGNNISKFIPIFGDNYFKCGLTIISSIIISIVFHYQVEKVLRKKILSKYHLKYKSLE